MLNGCLENIIKKRRSIRKYKDTVPPEEWIEKILRCALWAPSPSNLQPVRYIRIESKQIKEDLYYNMQIGKKRLLKKWEEFSSSKRLRNLIDVYYHKYAKFMFEAPVMFAVGVKKIKKGFYITLKEAGIKQDYVEDYSLYISLGLSLSHFILEAEKLGLGTCILTTPLIFLNDLEKIIGIKDVNIGCFITLGYPDESPVPPKRLSISDICIKI